MSVCADLLSKGNREYDRCMKWVSFADPSHRQKASDIVVEFYEHMDNHITLFPIFGTLLGIIRENSLIPHDLDVDFGYFRTEQQQMIAGLDSLHGKNGFVVCRNQGNSLFSIAKDDVPFDLYGYSKSGDSYTQEATGPTNRLLSSEVDPMNTVEFNGCQMPSIGNPQAFFERYYGADWETPRVTIVPPKDIPDA
tara:strand:+ start:1514 stop:2095 length:582 start_codon:yes stop_codon:yes gene_type:complete